MSGRYIYFRKNGGMRFWRVGHVGGSIYLSTVDHTTEQRIDSALLGLVITNILLLLVIAAQRIANYV